ncbi:sensor histidine kinase [Rubneribacter badeniensis]|nr:HAMP domain-containing sensor histidine kinase [Rubneribacter badeniensis]
MFELLLAGFVLVVACAAGAVALYERELRRLARFLEERDPASNERAGVEFATSGTRALARAVNATLDAQREASAAAVEHARAFRRDLAALSHDIRTPLAGAQGYLQLYARTKDEAERARCVAEARERLAAMRTLTDRLFDHAKAADPDAELTLERVEVLPVLADVLAAAYPDFLERGTAPVVDFADEEFSATADADALARVFANLVTNALRHGAGDVRIIQRGRTLSFSNAVPAGAAPDAERLFDRFYKADAARGGEGAGLGLSIVASLCEKMGAKAAAHWEGDELAITLTLAE